MKLPPDLVLFDCDGVLVDSEKLTTVIIRDSFARYGLDIPQSEVARLFVGGTMMDVMQTAREMGAQLADSWVEDIYEVMYAELAARVEAVPGIFGVLDALDAAGIPYAVGSNGRHRKMEITLTRTGLMARLQGRIYSRQDVARPKPAPDLYLRAAADAGIAPERCVVVEDSVAGARAGKAAGMACFGFVADSDPERMATICDMLFDDMAVLPGMLGL